VRNIQGLSRRGADVSFIGLLQKEAQ